MRISLSHNGDVRYIVTPIVINSTKEFRDGQIVKRPDAAYQNTRLRSLLQKYQKAIDEADYIDGLTCAELLQYIKVGSDNDNKTLNDVFEEYLRFANVKESTKSEHGFRYRMITRTLDGGMLVKMVQRTTVLTLDKALRDAKKASTSVYNVMGFFKVLVKYAVRCGYAQFKVDPFLGYKMPRAEVRQAWLTVDEIRMVRDFKTNRSGQAFVRDMFMLSYYLGGINAIDLADIDFNRCAMVLKYERKKTERLSKVNKYVEMRMPPEALELAKKYTGEDGHITLLRRARGAKEAFSNIDFIGRKLGLERLIYESA